MESPTAPLDLTLSDLERSVKVTQILEVLFVVMEPS